MQTYTQCRHPLVPRVTDKAWTTQQHGGDRMVMQAAQLQQKGTHPFPSLRWLGRQKLKTGVRTSCPEGHQESVNMPDTHTDPHTHTHTHTHTYTHIHTHTHTHTYTHIHTPEPMQYKHTPGQEHTSDTDSSETLQSLDSLQSVSCLREGSMSPYQSNDACLIVRECIRAHVCVCVCVCVQQRRRHRGANKPPQNIRVGCIPIACANCVRKKTIILHSIPPQVTHTFSSSSVGSFQNSVNTQAGYWSSGNSCGSGTFFM